MDHIRILLKCKVLESMRYCEYMLLYNQLGKFKEHLSCVKRSSTFPYNSGNLKNLRLISIMEWRGGCWNHALHRKAGMQITKLMEYPVTREYGKGWIWQSCKFFVSFDAGKNNIKSRGGSRILLKRRCTTKKWHNKEYRYKEEDFWLGNNVMWTAENTYQTIPQTSVSNRYFHGIWHYSV